MRFYSRRISMQDIGDKGLPSFAYLHTFFAKTSYKYGLKYFFANMV
jgi:hypothetical protein